MPFTFFLSVSILDMSHVKFLEWHCSAIRQISCQAGDRTSLQKITNQHGPDKVSATLTHSVCQKFQISNRVKSPRSGKYYPEQQVRTILHWLWLHIIYVYLQWIWYNSSHCRNNSNTWNISQTLTHDDFVFVFNWRRTT